MKRKNKWTQFLAGILTALLVCGIGIPVLASTPQIRIVIDGQEIHPTDANGKTVNPIIIDGTTYLPVRAVANAFGKEVYWDGPNYTVYLGKMDGALEYPSVMLKDMTSIDKTPKAAAYLKDNFGNTYGSAIYNSIYPQESFEYLLSMKYSKFKCTLYIPEGYTFDDAVTMTITADGRQIYTSPQMTKTSAPVKVEVNVTGYNDFKIQFSHFGAAANKA